MCNGCVSLSGGALDRYVAALAELDRRRLDRSEIARRYRVPVELLPEEEEVRT